MRHCYNKSPEIPEEKSSPENKKSAGGFFSGIQCPEVTQIAAHPKGCTG